MSVVPDPLPPAAADEVSELAEVAPEVLDDAVQVALDGEDSDAAQEVLSARDRVRKGVGKVERWLFEEADPDADVDHRSAHALHALERTVEHIGSAAEAGLRTAVRTHNMDERPTRENGSESEPAEHSQRA